MECGTHGNKLLTADELLTGSFRRFLTAEGRGTAVTFHSESLVSPIELLERQQRLHSSPCRVPECSNETFSLKGHEERSAVFTKKFNQRVGELLVLHILAFHGIQ